MLLRGIQGIHAFFPSLDHKQVNSSLHIDRRKRTDLHSGTISMPEQLQYVCVRMFVWIIVDVRLNPSGGDVVAD